MARLEGRRILVTGAASGIGAAAVRVLAAEGAAVAAVHRLTSPPEDLRARAHWVKADMTVRDHFAGLAMLSMLVGTECGPDDVASFVGSAYILADAMLKERAK